MKLSGIVNAPRALMRRARAFAGARRGNVAMIFGLTIIPIMIAGGASIDLSRGLTARNALQAALDAATLAVATAPASADKSQVAHDYFFANFHLDNSFGSPTLSTPVITATSAQLTATINVPTTVMKIATIDTMPITDSSTVVWGQTKLWVSLVLDNTGSMADNGKMDALKTATHQLLGTLEGAAANPGDVQVALVPFVKDVNVGNSYYNQSWIYWGTSAQDPGLTDNTSWDATNGTCTISSKHSRSSCTSSGSCSISGHNSQSSCQSAGTCSLSDYTTQSSCQAATGSCSISGYTSKTSCTGNGVCSKSQYSSSKTQCLNHSGTWTTGVWTNGTGVWTAGVWTPGAWTPADHSTWNGCVTDRGDPSGPSTPAYDTMNTAPNSTSASLFPAEQYSSCPQALQPLTYDWTSLSDETDNMAAAGNTNQTIGLAWGWQALTDGDPLNPGTLPANTTPVMILMTDGLNTQNRWSSSQSSIDTRMGDACTNFKNWQYDASDSSKHPIIYTIQVDIGGVDGVSSVLQSCATDTSKYFHLTTAGSTITVFNQIATEITNMRLSH